MHRFIIGILGDIGFLHVDDSNTIAEHLFTERQCELLAQGFADAARMLKEVREKKVAQSPSDDKRTVGTRHDLKTWISGKN